MMMATAKSSNTRRVRYYFLFSSLPGSFRMTYVHDVWNERWMMDGTDKVRHSASFFCILKMILYSRETPPCLHIQSKSKKSVVSRQ